MFSKITLVISAISSILAGICLLWRRNAQAQEEVKNANFVSEQAKTVQGQMEKMVSKAAKVIAEQREVESATDTSWDSIHEWLRDSSSGASPNSSTNGGDKRPSQDDSAEVSSKDGSER